MNHSLTNQSPYKSLPTDKQNCTQKMSKVGKHP